jgi:hypothetical protein
MEAKQILEKHWRKFRLDIGLKYEPMSERFIDCMTDAMHDYAAMQGGPDLIGKSQGDIAQMMVVNCIRFLDDERRIAVVKKLTQKLSEEQRDDVIQWVNTQDKA